MNPIFISYRRDDNISAAKLLKEILEHELSKNTVFLDTTNITPGEKWRGTLKEAVSKARVVIAFMGPYWKGEKYWETKSKEDNRLLSEEDWVRLELETALKDESKLIIPMIFRPDKIKDFDERIHFANDTLPPGLISLSGNNNQAVIHEKQFEKDLRDTILAISEFITPEDVLKDLPLPEKDPQNKLDRLPDNPFKGLDYFTEEDARIFFGRGEQILELFHKLEDNPLVLFYGQSGVGKSSLLFAGLKRRMENKGWSIEYWRRDPTFNLAEKLNIYVENTVNEKTKLVILDQIEEIYTNPGNALEKFQLIESIENALKNNVRILLGFREEYLSKIKELFDEKSIKYGTMPLRHMQVKGVLDAIKGITKSPQTRSKYSLSFEDKKDLPRKIAYLVLNDEQSHIAPLLQLLLRKLWDRVADNDGEKVITEKLFDEVKSQSLNDMLNDQIKLLRKDFPDEIKSGLVLDLLYFFTTQRGTSASHTNEELKANYKYDKILDLTEALKKKYLLIDLKIEKIYTTRLAHDSLAPIIREMHSQSQLPAERAAILLESKKKEIEDKPDKVEFSKSDLTAIETGKEGMRIWTGNEKYVIENNRKRIDKEALDLIEKNKQLEIALEEAKEQTQKIQATALADKAKENLTRNPMLALQFAEAAYQKINVQTNDTVTAVEEIIGTPSRFNRHIFDSDTSDIYAIEISPDGNWILEGRDDYTVRLFDSMRILKFTLVNVSYFSFSPDGQLILTGSPDHTVSIWNLSGKPQWKMKGHLSRISSVTFSPDGKLILTGSYDNTARLWLSSGECTAIFIGHSDSITCASFSPDGKAILTGSDDKTARLWDLGGKFIQNFVGHLSSVTSVGFYPDKKSVFAGSDDNSICLWDLKGNLKETFKLESIVKFLSAWKGHTK